MSRCVIAVLLSLLLPVLAGGQSLAEMSRREKERREKNKQKGVQVRVVGEDEISSDKDQEGDKTSDADSENSTSAAVNPSDKDEKDGNRSDEPSRAQQEAEWRSRMNKARDRLEVAEEKYQFLDSLYLVNGEYYVDENGRPVITSIQQLQRMVREAKAEFETAAQAMENLKETARRAGIPPGWLR